MHEDNDEQRDSALQVLADLTDRQKSEKLMLTRQLISDLRIIYRSVMRMGIIFSLFSGFALMTLSAAGQSPFETTEPLTENDKLVDGEKSSDIEHTSDDLEESFNDLEILYQDLVTSFNQEDWQRALTLFDQFQQHEKTGYKDVLIYGKRAIRQLVKTIPVSDAGTNLRLYQKLLDLDPQNSVYNKKVAFYFERTYGAIETTSKLKLSPRVKTVDLFQYPDLESRKVVTASKPTVLITLAENNSWYQVQSDQGVVGWVRKECVE